MKLLHQDITEPVIKAFYKVYNTLGYGFLEKVYENALMVELRNAGLNCISQVPVKVSYNGEIVGNYFADILVEDKVTLELKAATSICEEHEAQLINYLKATDIEIGLLLNFGKTPQFVRKIFENEYK
jgi:GxxExxY protein